MIWFFRFFPVDKTRQFPLFLISFVDLSGRGVKMKFKDLRQFISFLEEKRELLTVKVPVDPELEITEIADRMIKSSGPALFFEEVKGAHFPLVINLFGSFKRAAWALGVDDFKDLPDKVTRLIPHTPPSGFLEKIGFLFKFKELSDFQPKKVDAAPVQEVIGEPDFTALPVLKCWPHDGGRYITLPLVITKDPQTMVQNVGMYRMQIFDEKTAGMHWHPYHDGARHYRLYQEMGKRMEVAVALGGDPATIYSATAPVPPGIDEIFLAGFLRGEGVEVVKSAGVDLWVPAQAEFILEGYVERGEVRREGPFGDHTGFYSGADDYPVFHLTSITRRKNPVYPATIVGRPPMEDYFMGKATERLFLPLIKLFLPEVFDINMPGEGVFHNCLITSIKKAYPGQTRKVASALWGMGQMMLTKVIIVVDAEVDVQNCSEVAWKVLSNVDPERDIFFQRGPLDVLDHATGTPGYGSKVGIDGTKKGRGEGYTRSWPDEATMSGEIKRFVDRRWKEYGFE
jgi:4-hydroxy-3-polyprenylbenzoate decarboxylase